MKEFFQRTYYTYYTHSQKRPKENVANYRPIAKLSCVGKIFEKLLTDTIFDAVRDKIMYVAATWVLLKIAEQTREYWDWRKIIEADRQLSLR
jgi:hypothetical protein